MTKANVHRISDAIAMSVRWEPATLATLGYRIPGFTERNRDKAWVWWLNHSALGAYLSEDGIDGLLHAVHNRRVAIGFCERSDYPYDEILCDSPDWIPAYLARPQSANVCSIHRPHIFHVYGKWLRLLYEIEPGARYLKIAGATNIPRPSSRG